MSKFRLYEQADRGVPMSAPASGFRGIQPAAGEFVYSWMLEGNPYSQKKKMAAIGWKWIPGVGCRGCYTTNNAATAAMAATKLDLAIESNGTHKAIGAPMYFDLPASVSESQAKELENIFEIELLTV